MNVWLSYCVLKVGNCDLLDGFKEKVLNVLEQKKNSKCDTSDDSKKESLKCFGRREPCSVECRLGSDYLRHWFAHLSNNHHGFISFYNIKNDGEEKKCGPQSPHR